MSHVTSEVLRMVNEAQEEFIQVRKDKQKPAATEAELEAFRIKVTEGILRSQERCNNREQQEDRANRLEDVRTKAHSQGVKFLHNRKQEEIEELISERKINRKTLATHYITQVSNATLGGQTLAFKYRLDPVTNDLYMVYAVAFCRSDENFDPLIGMEESLDKFLAGEVMETFIAHEKLGNVKLSQMARSYKHNVAFTQP